jgi:hypothetical protein
MLAVAPPDVAADMTDPFGVASMHDQGQAAASQGQYDAYGNEVGASPAYPPDDGYADPNADYSTAPEARVVAASPPQPEWPAAPPPRRKRQGFFSWLFNPQSPPDVPLSYAP